MEMESHLAALEGTGIGVASGDLGGWEVTVSKLITSSLLRLDALLSGGLAVPAAD